MKITRFGNNLLKNDGTLELFFLGVGSAFSELHNQTSFLIVKGDRHVLVDCGETGVSSLRQFGINPVDIEIILPTHSHPDHVAGMATLGFYNRYIGIPFKKKQKIKAIVPQEYVGSLWDKTLRGGMEWGQNQKNQFEHLAFEDYFEHLVPIKNGSKHAFEIVLGDLKIEMFRTRHLIFENGEIPQFYSYGMCIDDKVFYSGDSRFDKEIIEKYSYVEKMFQDVQFYKEGVHTPLDDLKTLDDSIKKKMYLVHYSDDYKEHDISDFAGWAKQGKSYIFKDEK